MPKGQNVRPGLYGPIPDRALEEDESIVALPNGFWTSLPPNRPLLIDNLMLIVMCQLVMLPDVEVTIVGADKWQPHWLDHKGSDGKMKDRLKHLVTAAMARYLDVSDEATAEHIESQLHFVTEKRFRKTLGPDRYRLETVEDV